uniref:Response regulatory domain-containing protein n=1 Tax=Ascaris lumbricoides TaxID=6252 RepID=A0A0M3I9W6_ASCLU
MCSRLTAQNLVLKDVSLLELSLYLLRKLSKQGRDSDLFVVSATSSVRGRRLRHWFNEAGEGTHRSLFNSVHEVVRSVRGQRAEGSVHEKRAIAPPNA